ncbi:hypothetical protein, partial [Spiroplasma sp. AdecLV25b]|uniref:hypothetical protein n=1 Tax=Spiroplasma sp. AdecLV25b TaxID=3027162 RepID=UPI0027E1B9DF
LDKTKIDINQIPSFVFEHLDLSLLYLNDAISKGFITPNIVNQEVQLNYHGINQSNYLNTDNNIIEFNDSSKNKNLQSEMPQIWFSTYEPSHWWRFWEWGTYVHLDHNAVSYLQYVKIIAEISNVAFLFKNIADIQKEVTVLEEAIKSVDNDLINETIKKLGSLFGGIELSQLGNISDILTIVTTAVSIGFVLLGLGSWTEVIIGVITTLIISIVSTMQSVDYDLDIKWQWANFIIPCGIYSE